MRSGIGWAEPGADGRYLLAFEDSCRNKQERSIQGRRACSRRVQSIWIGDIRYTKKFGTWDLIIPRSATDTEMPVTTVFSPSNRSLTFYLHTMVVLGIVAPAADRVLILGTRRLWTDRMDIIPVRQNRTINNVKQSIPTGCHLLIIVQQVTTGVWNLLHHLYNLQMLTSIHSNINGFIMLRISKHNQYICRP